MVDRACQGHGLSICGSKPWHAPGSLEKFFTCNREVGVVTLLNGSQANLAQKSCSSGSGGGLQFARYGTTLRPPLLRSCAMEPVSFCGGRLVLFRQRTHTGWHQEQCSVSGLLCVILTCGDADVLTIVPAAEQVAIVGGQDITGLPGGRILSERHNSAVMKLLGLVETALAPLFPRGKEDRRLHEARVLWASLYGIASLAVSQKLPEAEKPEDMAASLAANYIAGLRVQCAA